MLEPLINRTIDNRWIVLGLTLILVGFGLFAAVHLPVDAYPDISPHAEVSGTSSGCSAPSGRSS